MIDLTQHIHETNNNTARLAETTAEYAQRMFELDNSIMEINRAYKTYVKTAKRIKELQKELNEDYEMWTSSPSIQSLNLITSCKERKTSK